MTNPYIVSNNRHVQTDCLFQNGCLLCTPEESIDFSTGLLYNPGQTHPAVDAGRVYIPLPNEMSPEEHAVYYFKNEMSSDQRRRGMNENFVDFLVRHNFRKNIAMEISKKMNEEPFIVKVVEDFWFKDSDLIATLMDDLIVDSLAAAKQWMRSNRSVFPPAWVKIKHKKHLLKLWETIQNELEHSWRDQ